MDGIINVLKPPGMTSFDVVAYIRKRARQPKQDMPAHWTRQRRACFRYVSGRPQGSWNI